MNENDPYDDFSSDYPQPDQPGQPGPTDPPPPPPPNYGQPQGPTTCSSCGADLTGVAIGSSCKYCGQPVGPSTYGAATQGNGKAIASLVLGICSIPVCFCYGILSIILGVIGVVLGSIATKEIKRGGYSESARGMATAGKICSWIGIVLGVGYIIFFIILIVASTNAPAPNYQTYPSSPSSSPSYQFNSGSSSSNWNSGPRHDPFGGNHNPHRAALPDGLEYGPNGQVRPAAPSGLQYGPGGQLQPVAPSPGAGFGPAGPSYP